MANKSASQQILVQKQIRDNVTEVQDFLADLSNWSTEMKAKELADSSVDLDLTQSENVPLRNDPRRGHVDKPKESAQRKPDICDYSRWDKYDADKACDDMESSENNGPESHDEAARRKAIKLRLQKLANEKKDMGNECLRNKNYEMAVEHYSDAIRCDKNSSVLYANRAQAYIYLHEYQKAVDDCTESIKNDSTYVKAYFRRGKARFKLGKLVDAKNDLNQVLKIQPGNAEAKQLVAEINKKALKSLFSGTPPKTESVTEAPKYPSKSSMFPGVQTIFGQKVLSKRRLEDDEDEDGGKGDTDMESNVKYPIPVLPIKKPPERRSKRPLLPVHVKVVGEDRKKMRLDYNGNEGSNSPSLTPSNSSSSINTPVADPSSPSCSTNPTSPSNTLPNLFSQLKMTTIPPKPNTAAQFVLDWKKLKPYPEMCAKYLQQMNCSDYEIFQDSMEYSVLSDILDLLLWEFLPQKWDFVSHLQGLLRVKRFATLVMFMTEKDRANARKLISECPENIQSELKAKYNV